MDKYVVTGGAHTRTEEGPKGADGKPLLVTKTYADGDPIAPTEAELKAFPDKFKVVGSSKQSSPDAEAQLQTLGVEKQTLESQVATLTTQLSAARSKAEEMAAEADTADKEAEKFKKLAEKSATEKSKLETQLQEAQTELTTVKADLKTAQAQVADLTKERDKLKAAAEK